jgi:hypothetical protein
MISSMRALLLVTLVAACGPNPAPVAPRPVEPVPDPITPTPLETEPEELGIDWSTVPYATDEQAMDAWRRLGLDGDSWQLRLSDVPVEASGLRVAMAKALLRGGNFACPAIPSGAGCHSTELEFQPIAPSDDLDSPCLRRQLAMWALDELEGVTLQRELAADTIALAGLPPPEDDLNREVLAKITDEALRLQMLEAAERAGNETVADESLGNLSDAAIQEAGTRLHIDGAVEALDVGDALDMYARALVDAQLRMPTRLKVAQELAGYANGIGDTDPSYPAVVKALERGAADPDCTIAAASTEALASVDGRRFPSAPPKGAKPAAYLRALCVVVLGNADPDPLWISIVGPKGIALRSTFEDLTRVADDEDDPDPDGDGNPTTWAEVERIPREQMTRLSDDADFKKALAGCTGTECRVPGQNLTYRFTFKKAGGRLLLDAIERHEVTTGCDTIAP